MANNIMNDLMFNQVLMSDGYVVDFAIGTTYGLDMESLLSIPLTMELMKQLCLHISLWKPSENQLIGLSFFVMQAISLSRGIFQEYILFLRVVFIRLHSRLSTIPSSIFIRKYGLSNSVIQRLGYP